MKYIVGVTNHSNMRRQAVVENQYASILVSETIGISLYIQRTAVGPLIEWNPILDFHGFRATQADSWRRAPFKFRNNLPRIARNHRLFLLWSVDDDDFLPIWVPY